MFSFLLQTDALTIIAEDDWKLLCEDWGGIISRGISARIEINNSSEDDMVTPCEEMPISEEHVNMHYEVNLESSRRPIVKTSPPVILDCIHILYNCVG